ncbi:MAG: AsmA family protein [Chromatiaceae bacterium]|nr:AsmA family protein [Chromatiaceae bacterium]MCP5312536.1 AsmA family protein [Chromatiaceae bacterium]
MGSLLKWLIGTIVVVLLLLVAAAVILPMVIDPNDYKPQIVQAAKDKLGRDLVIEQDLDLSVFPWLGIETGGVRLGNAPGFEASSFAEIDQLGVKVKLMPLLSRQVEIDTLVIKGLRLNLEKDAKGRTNWDDLAAGAADEAEKPVEPTPSEGESTPLTVHLQGIQIEDARIAWQDRQAGQSYVLDGVRLVTGALAPGATVPVEAGMTFTSVTPAMTLKVGLDARVSSDQALKVFRVDGLSLALDASGEGLPADGAQLELKTDLVADTKADTLRLDNLSVTGPAMAAKGEIALSALQTNPAAKGRLTIAETNLKTLASMFASPIETTDPAVLTRASGELDFSYADGALKLDPLAVRLDDSSLSGHLHLLPGDGPVVRTRLDLDQIDLDRYMPPAVASDTPAAEPVQPGAETASATATGDPFAALRTLDFVGEFKIGKLTVAKARMTNVTSKIVSSKGVLKVEPMTAQLYEGNFNGAVTLDASGAKPKVQVKEALTGIQIGQLLGDVAGENRLVGRGEVHADISVVGLSESEVRQTLNGTSRFAFRDGAWKGANIAQIIREASAALNLGGGKLDVGTPGQTDFSELGGSLKMTNGVIRNDDLQAKSPLLRIAGKGEVNLPKDSVDYSVTTELVNTLEGQGGKARDELAGVPIPVRIKGPIANPSYKPDLQAALSAKAKSQIAEKQAELQKKAEDKVKDKVGDVLKGLFK